MNRILILGGTGYIGRVFIEQLLASGEQNDIVMFNRGKTNADLFPTIQKVIGDRETTDIEQVTNKDWDYVIDFSCYNPKSLRHFLQASKGRIGRMIFTSTVSTYAITESVAAPLTEDAPLWDCTPEQYVDTSMATYGNRKVACERELFEMTELDKVILRPSVVFGKYDYINRHLYWMHRAETQSRILLPNGGVQTDNYTFVEDYAALIIKAMQAKTHRVIYNASTQPVHTLRELVETSARCSGTQPELISCSKEQLLELGLNTNNERIALFFGGINVGFNHDKAVQDFGIQYHSIEQGMKKMLDYYRSIAWKGLEDIEKRYLTEAKEQEIINKFLNC